MIVKVRQTCRLCGSKSLTPILDLGPQMLASAFASKDNEDRLPTRKVPLELVRCNPLLDENACGLVQLKHTFPSDIMYTDYWYASGVNQSMRDALADITSKAVQYVDILKGDIVVDIGCNDGTLLKSYKNPALELVGFDPAKNFVGVAGEGFTRINDYFNKQSYIAAKGQKKAKIVTSIAMFYDLEDPVSFSKDIFDILADDGIWVLQMADLPNMLTNNMFDNICHEHTTYYSLSPMEYIFKRCGMKLVDVEMNNVNGSSYRFYIHKSSGPDATVDAVKRIAKVRFDEFNMALDTDEPYKKFKENIERNKNDLLFFINQERAKGKKIFVYGASTKGNVLLQYCGLNEEIIPYAAERNPRKWGTRTLGSNIPIISEEDARAMKPDYFLVLPYHFLDEMIVREKEFIDRGGKFIVPVPSVKLVP
jgi:trans-aconitate methyltransferase